MSDPVNSPSHYRTDEIEAIDVIEAFFKDKYHLGNVFKYIARAGKKDNELQDLRKAEWYLKRWISTREAELSNSEWKVYKPGTENA